MNEDLSNTNAELTVLNINLQKEVESHQKEVELITQIKSEILILTGKIEKALEQRDLFSKKYYEEFHKTAELGNDRNCWRDIAIKLSENLNN